MHRVTIHRHQGKLDIIRFGNRPTRPMPVNISNLEILEIPPIG
jgi:hypothetical protein